MKSSTLLRKETVIPAFSVSLILVFAFVMPGNAFHSNGDEQQCGYGYGQTENDDQQGDNNDQGCEVDNENDNEVGNTSGDDNLSEGGDTEDAQGETGDNHVTKKTVVVHISAPTTTTPVHTESGDGDSQGGDGDHNGGGDDGGDDGGGGD